MALKDAYYSGLTAQAKGAHVIMKVRRDRGLNGANDQTTKVASGQKDWESRRGSDAVAGSRAEARPVGESHRRSWRAVLPNDANSLGNMLGGRVMHLIDIAGALAATPAFEQSCGDCCGGLLDFRFPIRVGEWIVLKSSVNRVFHTSMEVGVKVFAENILTGERRHTSSAYVTFVAMDMNRQPHPVPPLILKTEDDRRRYREAGERRRMRLAHAQQMPISDT